MLLQHLASLVGSWGEVGRGAATSWEAAAGRHGQALQGAANDTNRQHKLGGDWLGRVDLNRRAGMGRRGKEGVQEGQPCLCY